MIAPVAGIHERRPLSSHKTKELVTPPSTNPDANHPRTRSCGSRARQTDEVSSTLLLKLQVEPDSEYPAIVPVDIHTPASNSL
jgi:hypothetical protein